MNCVNRQEESANFVAFLRNVKSRPLKDVLELLNMYHGNRMKELQSSYEEIEG